MSNVIKYLPKVKKKKIGIIIQARMGSKRFSGKVMQHLYGKPVLQHVVERCKQIRGEKGNNPDHVIVAVPDEDASEPLLQLAQSLGVENFCGSELNVLDRYYQAAKFFNLDYIVRITSDCPMINPIVSSEVLQLLLWRKLDYCSNCYPSRSYPKGYDTEAFTFDCLDAAYQLADNDYHKEHVTTWMVENMSKLKTSCVMQHKNKSHINLCVDEPSDIERLEQMAMGISMPIKVSV